MKASTNDKATTGPVLLAGRRAAGAGYPRTLILRQVQQREKLHLWGSTDGWPVAGLQMLHPEGDSSAQFCLPIK